jgi:hypothetical protein
VTPKNHRFTVEQILPLFEQFNGNVSVIARQLKTTRKTIYDYIKKHKTLQDALEDSRETMVDAAESALFAAVTEKQGWAVCFTLKCLGKERGYIERSEIQHSGSLTMEQAEKMTPAEALAYAKENGLI